MLHSTLSDLVDSAREELRDWRQANPYATESHDAIFEIADSLVPVYTGDLIQLAAEHLPLATNEPEIGPAFDGKPTPTNIIAANVFEYLESALWDAWRDLQGEEGDDDDA